MLEALVTSRRFERGVQLVLLLNTFTVMAELKFEYAPDRVDAQYAFSGWEVVELTFCLVYAVEMAVKMILVGPAAYCSTWRNRLDGSLTVLSLVGELTVVALGTRYSVLRVVIFARLLRLLRRRPTPKQVHRTSSVAAHRNTPRWRRGRSLATRLVGWRGTTSH